MKQIILLLSLTLILAGCASKRYVKKGMMLENSGLYSDAAISYYTSLQKNINNIDAKLGLQRTGQLVLDDNIEKFKSQYQNGAAKDAVYAYRTADNYFKKLQGVGIKLMFPEEQKSYYKEVEDTYLSQLYAGATKALSLDQFASAEKQFSEILSINTNYKDAKSKWVVAKYEPIYRKGNELMQTNMYRSAYLTFKGIIDKVSVYENSLDLMNKSLDQAKITIYVASVNTNQSSYRTIASQLNSKIVKGINDINSPLYEVVGTGTTSSSKNKYQKAFQFDRTKGVINSTRRPASKAVLEARVQKYSKNNGHLYKTEKHGYIKLSQKYIDEVTKLEKHKTVYKKVKYYEYRLERKVVLTLAYSMKRTDRNEVAVSNTFNKEEVDKILYADFEGDYKTLVPGTWKSIEKDSEEDKIYDNSNSVAKMHKTFKARRTTKSLSELENILTNKCITQITQEIRNYKPEN